MRRNVPPKGIALDCEVDLQACRASLVHDAANLGERRPDFVAQLLGDDGFCSELEDDVAVLGDTNRMINHQFGVTPGGVRLMEPSAGFSAGFSSVFFASAAAFAT